MCLKNKNIQLPKIELRLWNHHLERRLMTRDLHIQIHSCLYSLTPIPIHTRRNPTLHQRLFRFPIPAIPAIVRVLRAPKPSLAHSPNLTFSFTTSPPDHNQTHKQHHCPNGSPDPNPIPPARLGRPHKGQISISNQDPIPYGRIVQP